MKAEINRLLIDAYNLSINLFLEYSRDLSVHPTKMKPLLDNLLISLYLCVTQNSCFLQIDRMMS